MISYGQLLIDWYDANKREMPWRKTRDPYCIWVSEVMLQQTQVDTVIPYYIRFIERFPTIESLANASEEEVYTYWQGLGYYRRASYLHKGAKVIKERYRGVFPNEPKLAKDIPGIGPYTLGAVMSIAFDQPLPAVDGNVMRVLSRQFLIDEDIAKSKSRKIFEDKVMTLMPYSPNKFNQALMELGATVCTPRNPKCSICPMIELCSAYEEGVMLEYPVKSKKGEQLEEYYVALVCLEDNQLYLEKRQGTGLLANMWGIPLVTHDEWIEIKNQLPELEEESTNQLETVKHIFTHKKWFMTPIVIYNCKKYFGEIGLVEDDTHKLIDTENLEQYAIPTAFQKIIDKITLKY